MRLAVIVGSAWLLMAVGVACTTENAALPPPEPVAEQAGTFDSGEEEASDAGESLAYPLNQVCPPGEPSDNACTTCVRASCCVSREAILGDDAGNGLVDCIQDPACNLTETCVTNCFGTFPEKVQPLLDHMTCMRHRCDPCAGDKPKCSVCTDTRCRSESIACGLSRDCFLLETCASACDGSEPCITACFDRYPGGADLENAFLVCALSRCESECK